MKNKTRYFGWYASRPTRVGGSNCTGQAPVYKTQAARVLLWGSWAALAAGLGLLRLGHETGLLLLLLGVGYWASYYLGRSAAARTE